MPEPTDRRIWEGDRQIEPQTWALERQNTSSHRIGYRIGLPRRLTSTCCSSPDGATPQPQASLNLRYFISLLVSLCLSFSFFIWRMKYESENWNEIMKRESMRLSSLFLSLSLYLILYFSLWLSVAFSLLLSFIHNFINICPIFGFFPVWVLVLVRLLIVF